MVAAMICMFGLYVYNRIRDQRQRERILGSSSLRSSSISQVSQGSGIEGPAKGVPNLLFQLPEIGLQLFLKIGTENPSENRNRYG